MPRNDRPRVRNGILLLSILAGCAYWKNEPPVGAPAVITETSPRTVRVTLADGSRVRFRKAWIAQDTLTGLGENGDTTRGALSQVMQLERRAVDQARTVLLLALFALGTATFAELDSDW
jgi:hypothetical protein